MTPTSVQMDSDNHKQGPGAAGASDSPTRPAGQPGIRGFFSGMLEGTPPSTSRGSKASREAETSPTRPVDSAITKDDNVMDDATAGGVNTNATRRISFDKGMKEISHNLNESLANVEDDVDNGTNNIPASGDGRGNKGNKNNNGGNKINTRDNTNVNSNVGSPTMEGGYLREEGEVNCQTAT